MCTQPKSSHAGPLRVALFVGNRTVGGTTISARIVCKDEKAELGVWFAVRMLLSEFATFRGKLHSCSFFDFKLRDFIYLYF